MNRQAEILLVEDDEGCVYLTQRSLRDSKVVNDLSVVNSGEDALDYLYKRNGFEDTNTPDIILLDMSLYAVTGQEVLDIIRADNELKHIPVIIITSSDDEEEIEKAGNSGANGYIVKPIDEEKLMTLLLHNNIIKVSLVTDD